AVPARYGGVGRGGRGCSRGHNREARARVGSRPPAGTGVRNAGASGEHKTRRGDSEWADNALDAKPPEALRGGARQAFVETQPLPPRSPDGSRGAPPPSPPPRAKVRGAAKPCGRRPGPARAGSVAALAFPQVYLYEPALISSETLHTPSPTRADRAPHAFSPRQELPRMAFPPLNPAIERALAAQGYADPTPVQLAVL